MQTKVMRDDGVTALGIARRGRSTAQSILCADAPTFLPVAQAAIVAALRRHERTG
jgi:hypothetical protein